jgi:hypothetical protein
MLKPGKLWNIDCFPITSFKGAQGELKARVIACNVPLHKTGYNFWRHIGISDMKRIRLAYSNERVSVAQPCAANLDNRDFQILPC